MNRVVVNSLVENNGFPSRFQHGVLSRFQRCLAALALACLSGLALAFTDLADSPYALAIVYLNGRGTVGGYPDGSYRPAAPVTRAELTTAVMRASGARAATAPARSAPCFADLPANDWAAPYVCAAKAEGIVGGDGAGAFSPDAPVSYAEAAKIALLGLVPGFTPTALSPWYLPYLDYADAKGLFDGQAYTPGMQLSRGAMAKLLYETLALGSRGISPLTYPSGHYSEGCGAPPPATPPSSLSVGGLQRDIITALPPDYRSDRTYALVVAFHGRTSPASEVRRYYRLEAGNTDTIFVYPSALPTDGGFSWFDPGDPPDALRDFALFDAILDAFRNRYCLDTRRVFLVGHSLGAHFANSLACARGNVVRAIGTLGGGVSPSGCTGRVAAMILHNPADRLAPVASGEAARDLFLQVDGLAGGADPVATAPASLNCMRYGPPGMAHPVIWCPHHQDNGYGGRYYPHNWPRATGPAIMAFFRSLP